MNATAWLLLIAPIVGTVLLAAGTNLVFRLSPLSRTVTRGASASKTDAISETDPFGPQPSRQALEYAIRSGMTSDANIKRLSDDELLRMLSDMERHARTANEALELAWKEATEASLNKAKEDPAVVMGVERSLRKRLENLAERLELTVERRDSN